MTAAFATFLAAATPSGEDAPLDLGSGGGSQAAAGGGGLVRTIVGLAVVLAVIYGLHWVLKQVKSGREGRAAGGGLESVASLPLGANRSLHVVRAGREVLVVGSGEHGVTPLRVYGEDEARAAGLLDWDVVDGTAVEAGDAATTPALPTRRPLAALPAPRQALDTLRGWTVRG
jgi:flagellar protein FliO/FliZ